MTYVVDFERHYDRGDYRFFLRRKAGKTTAAKVQLYSSGRVDSVSEVAVECADLPKDLQLEFRTLEAGSVPALKTESV